MSLSFQQPSKRLLQTDDSLTKKRDDDSFFDDNVFWHPSDGCFVSNDLPAEGQVPTLNICGVVQFQCSNGKAVALHVPFDYELHYNPDGDMNAILPYLEESMLVTIATAMGVHTCTASDFASRRRLLNFTDAEFTRFMGVSLEPRDVADAQFTDCIVDVSDEIRQTSECLPMQGGITVLLRLSNDEIQSASSVPDDEQAEVQQSILDFIQSSMDNDTFVSAGNIEKVSFVGSRLALEGGGELGTVKEIKPIEQTGLSSFTIRVLAICSALAFIVVILGAVFLRRKRRRKQDKAVWGATAADDDEENYNQRQSKVIASSDDSVEPKSLAFNDSLALKRQRFDQDVLSEASGTETLETESTNSHSPRRFPFIMIGLARHADTVHFDDADAVSQGSNSPTPSGLPRQLSSIVEVDTNDSVGDAMDDEYDNSTTASADTPRRVLQMT